MTTRPTQTAATPIIVIGAGITGLVCAQRLHAHGYPVTILEKSRGLGGRIATRRTPDGLSFDHGAQYVTARGESFGTYLASIARTGEASVWDPRRAPTARGAGSLTRAGDLPSLLQPLSPLPSQSSSPSQWFVGTPAMSALVRPLARDLDIRTEVTVTGLAHTQGQWQITATTPTGACTFRADQVVIAVPAPQAQVIAGHLPEVTAAISAVEIAPCWAVMAAFAHDITTVHDVWRPTSGPISWVARNAAKPGRPPATWVVHASPEWSHAYLEASPDLIGGTLWRELPEVVGVELPDPLHRVAHRWRYAQTVTALGRPFISAHDGTVLIGGDWTLGARVEAAWESGEAMATAVIT